jgi:flagellar motility protein MotE (MotC chaperone)
MKKTDPGIEHIRQVRHQISAEYKHDPKRLVEHYEKLQEKYSARVLEPLPPEEETSTKIGNR